MATDYNVIPFDLATVTPNPIEIAGSLGKKIGSISVLNAPTGSTSYIRIGSRTAPRLLLAVNRNFQMHPAEVDGVYFENDTVQVGTVELVVSYGDCSLVSNL